MNDWLYSADAWSISSGSSLTSSVASSLSVLLAFLIKLLRSRISSSLKRLRSFLFTSLSCQGPLGYPKQPRPPKVGHQLSSPPLYIRGGEKGTRFVGPPQKSRPWIFVG